MLVGMDVIYHNRRQLYASRTRPKLNVTYVSKEELLAKADFVSLNAPYTPDTYHIIGEEEFKQMKPSAILINTARGPLVDEHALVKALREGTIHGAGLDVFEFGDYPLPGVIGNGQRGINPSYRHPDDGNPYHYGTHGMQQRDRVLGGRSSRITGTASMTAAFVLSRAAVGRFTREGGPSEPLFQDRSGAIWRGRPAFSGWSSRKPAA